MLELLDAGLPAPAAGAFTTRAGGVSGPPWHALDLALHVADDMTRVLANRDLLSRSQGGVPLVFAQQVHGSRVVVLGGPPTCPAVPSAHPPRDPPAAPDFLAHEGIRGVDAVVTATRGLALVVLAADCLPVLLADPDARVVAVAHAGRAGLAAGVLQATLQAMTGLGATAAGITAVLGPAICGGCYELPQELADEVARRVPGSRATSRTGTPSIDLSAGAAAVLRTAGVVAVSRVGGCTAEQPGRFYSFRRDGVTGRHAGVVRLLP